MPKEFTAHVTKIAEQKYSRTENVYYRIGMRLDTGEFAFTDVVPSYRNFAWWKPIIEAGKGTKIGHLFLKDGYTKPLKVDADSEPRIIQETLVKDTPLPVDEPIFIVRAGDPEIWSVLSSKGNKRYEVTYLHGFPSCVCEKYRYSHKKCRHITDVDAYKKALEAKKFKQGSLL